MDPHRAMIPDRSSDTFPGDVCQEGQNMRSWTIGESSSSHPQNLVSHNEQMPQSGWSCPMNSSIGAGLRLEDHGYEPANHLAQSSVNLNLSSNHFVNRPAFGRSSTPSSSSSASQNHDLSEGQFHRVGDDVDCPNLSKSNGFESKFASSGGSSSDPFASSSGSGGFLADEDDGRPGCSLDGRRLSCKRKALEGNGGQSSSSGNCFPRSEGSMWHASSHLYDGSNSLNISTAQENSPSINPLEQVNPRLGLGVGGGVSASNFHSLNMRGGVESSQRNFRLRMNPSIQPDSTPNNSFLPPASNGHPDIPAVHQSFRCPNPPLNLMSPIQPESSVPQSQSVVLRVPTLRRNVQTLRWNRSPNQRPGSSISPTLGDREVTLSEDLNPRSMPRNIAEHPLFLPPVEARTSTQNSTNWSLGSGSVGISRNVPPSSRTGSGLGSHPAPGPSWASNRHPSSQYSRRLADYVRINFTSGSELVGQSSSSGQHRSGLSSSQESLLPPGAGNLGHAQSYSRSSSVFDRQQSDGVVGIPYSLRALAAGGEGRSRLVSEIRNVLDIMRRGEGLRFEDVMILDHSVFLGMADIHDQHRDMRLDVDNMSYEELLALEERIGNVCTGLSEETILKCMKQRKYIHAMSDDQTEAEPCCICQENYNDGDELGTLDCGHDFHTGCIKQWLAQKNLCPICKTTALAA